MKPTLARPHAIADVDALLSDGAYAMQVKLDGKRLLVETGGGRVRCFNRRGEPIGLPDPLAADFSALAAHRLILDGEYIAGDRNLWVFDLVEAGEVVSTTTPWRIRQGALQTLMKQWQPSTAVQLLPAYRTASRKRKVFERILRDGYEGAIFRKVDAPYAQGIRSASVLKVKNVRTVDCLVTALGTDKQNLKLALWDGTALVEVGECSRLEGEAPQARVGDVLEVAALGAGSPDRPRLLQPHARRVRTAEKDASEATIDQLDGLWTRKDVLS